MGVELRVAREEHDDEHRAGSEQTQEEHREKVRERRTRQPRVVQRRRGRGVQLGGGRFHRGRIFRKDGADEAEVRLLHRGRELHRELAASDGLSGRAGGQRVVALADERAADEEEVAEREVVLELPHALLFVVRAALVAVAQVVAAEVPVRGELDALLGGRKERLRPRRGGRGGGRSGRRGGRSGGRGGWSGDRGGRSGRRRRSSCAVLRAGGSLLRVGGAGQRGGRSNQGRGAESYKPPLDHARILRDP